MLTAHLLFWLLLFDTWSSLSPCMLSQQNPATVIFLLMCISIQSIHSYWGYSHIIICPMHKLRNIKCIIKGISFPSLSKSSIPGGRNLRGSPRKVAAEMFFLEDHLVCKHTCSGTGLGFCSVATFYCFMTSALPSPGAGQSQFAD